MSQYYLILAVTLIWRHYVMSHLTVGAFLNKIVEINDEQEKKIKFMSGDGVGKICHLGLPFVITLQALWCLDVDPRDGCFYLNARSLSSRWIFYPTLTLTINSYMSLDMRFLTMWYVLPATPQISLRIRAVWSEPLLVALIFYEC